jgi:hypothetical protein
MARDLASISQAIGDTRQVRDEAVLVLILATARLATRGVPGWRRADPMTPLGDPLNDLPRMAGRMLFLPA